MNPTCWPCAVGMKGFLRGGSDSFTRLEGHLAEQQPLVAEVKTALDTASRSIPKGHGDKSAALAQGLGGRPEGHGVRLPF